MNRSGFIAAFLALLLFAQGFSYPNQKNVDYPGDDNESDDDDVASDYDPPSSSAKEENSKPVRLTSKNSTMEVFPGEQIILPCETVNGEDQILSWRKNDDYLFLGESNLLQAPESSRINRTSNNSLVIQNARVTDSGSYICQLMANDKPHVNYTIVVSDRPQTLIISPGKSVVVNEKEDLVLSCGTSGPQPISLIWTHGSHKLHPMMKDNGRKAEIHIKHATRHNAGFYQCLADFGTGKELLHNVIDVTVKYAPEVQVLSDYVHSGLGQTTNLTCIVHAYPPAEIRWLHKNMDQPISTSNRIEIKDGKHIHNLTVKNIHANDFGKYICLATNSLGSHEKATELTGTPSRARFLEQDLKDDDKTIVLKWEVESFAPVKEYELRYQKDGESDWKVENPKVVLGGESNKYVVVHAIHNLEPNTYRFELRSRNKFGWSEYSIPQSIEGRYKVQKAGIAQGGGASSVQPIMFLIALLLVVSPIAFKNL